MIHATIDSIDEGQAVLALDDGGLCKLPSRVLPPGAREGDRIQLALSLLPAETAAAKRSVAEARARLTRDDDGGDISL